jgi:hypothetical protein
VNGGVAVEEYEALCAVIDEIRAHAPPEPATRQPERSHLRRLTDTPKGY